MAKLLVQITRDVMQIKREIFWGDKLVYLLVADRRIQYPHARSRIAYVGTTQNGISRIASSAADRAEDLLDSYGVRFFHVYTVTCTPRRNMETWKKLEHALIQELKEMYGDCPWLNARGGNREAQRPFSKTRLRNILEEFE